MRTLIRAILGGQLLIGHDFALVKAVEPHYKLQHAMAWSDKTTKSGPSSLKGKLL